MSSLEIHDSRTSGGAASGPSTQPLPLALPSPPPPPDLIDGHEEWEIDFIKDSRFSRRQLQYLVHWRGFDVSEDSWEPASTMAHATEAIAEFHERYPSKPKPRRSRARS